MQSMFDLQIFVLRHVRIVLPYHLPNHGEAWVVSKPDDLNGQATLQAIF